MTLPELGQKDPLEPKIEAFAVKQVFQGLDVGNGVCGVDNSGDVLQGSVKDLLEGGVVSMVDQGVLELELRGGALRHD